MPVLVSVRVCSGPKAASTVTSAMTLWVQVLVAVFRPVIVPLHEVQAVTRFPALAVAVSTTIVFLLNASEQSVPQLMPVPVMVPVPALGPLLVTVRTGHTKFAVTAMGAVAVSVHELVPEQAPLQPANNE